MSPRDFRRAADEAPASTEGQRECARGAWCTGYHLVPNGDGGSKREPGFTYQAFCQADVTLLTAHLSPKHGLPAAYWWLQADIGNPVRRAEMIRVPFGPRMPLSEAYDLLMHRITEVLCSWEQRVAEAMRLSLAPETDDYRIAKRAAGTLTKHMSVLLARPPQPMIRHIPSGELRAADSWRAASPLLELWQDAVLLSTVAARDANTAPTGNGMATLKAPLSGASAGIEIFDLHRRCLTALGQISAPAEILDGVPCRSCGNPWLVRDQAPDGQPRCQSCSCRAELVAVDDKTGQETWKHATPEPGEKPPPPDGHEVTSDKPSMYSRCPSLACGDRMDLKTFRAWVVRHEAWARSAGPLTCVRCMNGNCGECVYLGCSCAGEGHPNAA